MRELQTIVVHAWLACDDEQRSRVQFALHPVNIRFAIRKEDQRRQRFWGVATRCEIVVRDCCDQAEASTCHGENARFEHMRGRTPFSPRFSLHAVSAREPDRLRGTDSRSGRRQLTPHQAISARRLCGGCSRLMKSVFPVWCS